MRILGRKLKQHGHEYFLLEDGYNLDTRAVVVLCRPSNPAFKLEKPLPPVSLPEPGEWQAVARWDMHDGQGDLHLALSEHTKQADLLHALLEEYEQTARRPAPVAWALTQGPELFGTLERALPMGVAVHVYDDEATAQAAADQHGCTLVPIDDQARFLNQMVREGYAGAMWNATQPVFFCVDPDGALHYLRVSPGSHDVGLQLLDDKERWDQYEGAEEIQFLDNSEACDARLVSVVGNQPLRDWPASGRLVSIGPGPGTPGIVQSEDGDLRYALLFTEAERAEEFREDHDPTWVSFEVPDLTAYLGRDDLAGCIAQLNPGSHRADGGVLWLNGEGVVLDSFSGFWKLTEAGFEAAE